MQAYGKRFSGESIAKSRCPRGGFNLVEISLAIFVMALGLLVIFGLFPHGLWMADTARQDTQIGMFSEYVFNAMRREAASRVNTWAGSTNLFRQAVAFEDPYIDLRTAGDEALQDQFVRHHTGEPRLVRYPKHQDAVRHPAYLRYTLNVGMTADGVGTALLKVWPGRAGGEEIAFYTEFYPFMEIRP